MGLSSHLFAFMRLIFWVLLLNFTVLAHFSSSMQPLCHDHELSALLQFKESLLINTSASLYPSAYPKTASWKLEKENVPDCCSWDGVKCNEDTGHVVSLDLSSSFLYGSINSNSSLFHLVHLQWLSLSDNNFNHSKIPFEIMKLSRLSYLNLSGSARSGKLPLLLHLPMLDSLYLSSNSLSGTIPPSIGNLSKLVYLDLSFNHFIGELPTSLGSLAYLKQVEINTCNLSGRIPSSLGNLTELEFLEVSQNNFSVQDISSLSWITKSTKLSWLGLADTNLVGKIPTWVMNLTKLNYLVFDTNQLKGTIPSFLVNLNKLSVLSLMSNQINSQIPFQLCNLTQLRTLDLSSNKLHGSIPSCIFALRGLEYLDLSSNNLSGTVDLAMILHELKNLTVLFLSSNNVSLLTSNTINITVPQKFLFIGLSSCNLSEFPNFLPNQDQLEMLDLSSNKIHGHVPKWLLNVSTLEFLNLSHNLITGFDQQHHVLPWNNLVTLDLRFNKFRGPLPVPPASISHYLVSNNELTGQLSPWICNLSNLYSLDLSKNNLSVILPKCLGNFSHLLSMLNLQGNRLHGKIPESFMNATNLRMLDLSHNLLQGRVPRSLAECKMLEFLDLGNNQITDTFPSWLGTLPELKVLILRSNRFHGVIKEAETYFLFPRLRIIDLSHNRFTGNLPSEYFESWDSMKVVDTSKLIYMQDQPQQNLNFRLPSDDVSFNHSLGYIYDYSITMTNKGTEMEYLKVSNILTSIILSNNNFTGEIPASISILKGLKCLNLSSNNLTGGIPSSLSNLTALESLDLSNNMLSGEIPQQLVELTFLAFFNGSNNHLTGPIPQGKQFETFENSSFDGNLGLCGEPLSRKCENLETSQEEEDDHQDSEFPLEFSWKIVLTGYASGLIIGIIIGQTFTTRMHEWFVKISGRQYKGMQ